MLQWFEESNGDVVLHVRVVPRASRDDIIGVMDNGVLKIRIQAPPVDGKANTYLIRFLAGRWNIPRSSIAILSGETGRSKRLRIATPPPELIKELLSIKPC